MSNPTSPPKRRRAHAATSLHADHPGRGGRENTAAAAGAQGIAAASELVDAVNQQAATIRSLTLALHTLCATLQAGGVLRPGELSENLRCMRDASGADMAAVLEQLAAGLDFTSSNSAAKPRMN